jgi:REP element-mobilizing transposase RayT
MPRQARKKSKTGIYHVMLKGIDDRDIFLENFDRSKFIEQVIKAKEKAKFVFLAYCLMDNHAHLVIEEKNEEIGKSIKRITVGYVIWHNNKYGRTGHLFQNRFNSEVIETDNYLLTAVRYIHHNPVKAGIAKLPGDYEWSSYLQYLASYNNCCSNIDAQRIKGYLKTKGSFEEFMRISNDDNCLEYEQPKKYTDEAIRKIILREFDIGSIETMPAQERNRIIKDIYRETGVSIRQLGRVLGLGQGIIQRGVK